jgi:PAS domain S-box-containing protein
VSWLQRAAKVAAAFVVSIGCLVLIGWILDIRVFKSVLPNLATMKANTALGFILAGTSLFISTQPTSQGRRISQVCSLVVMALGLATLSEDIFKWNLGIDQLLFVDDPQPVSTLTPGRMSPLTAVCFAFVGSALWLSVTNRRRNSHQNPWVERLAILTILIAAQVVIAYLYHVHPIIGLTSYTQMAVHSAVCFVVLGIGILIANPTQGLMKIITAQSAGGIIVRRLLPAAIAIPLILGGLRIATARMGWLEPAFGTSILVVLHIITFTGLVLWNGKQLHDLDLQRQATAKALSQSHEELEAKIRERTAQLQAANEHLSLAIEGAGMAAWDMDLRTGKGVWSAQHFRLLGYEIVESGEVTIEMWRSRIYPEELERISQLEAQAKQENQLLNYEYRIIRADNGELRWLKSIGRFFNDETGQALRCSGIVFDITDSKLAQEERDRFFTLSNEMIAISGEDGYLKQLNPAWERVLGYTLTELMGQPFLNFVHPEDIAATREAAKRFETGNPAASFENRYRCQDGSYKWLSWTGVISPEHRLSYASARDVTQRKQAEIALREKEQQLQQLSDSMPQLVWITNAAGALEYVNRQWCEYLGLTLEESRNQAQTAEYYHPDDRQLILKQWAIAQQTKQSLEIEGRLKCSNDGVYRWFLIRAVPALDDQKQVLHWYGTSTDIHERKLAQLNDKFLNELDLRLRQLSNADAMLWEAVSSIGQYLDVERCVWHEVNLAEDLSIVKQDWRRQEDISSVVGVHTLSQSILPELIDCFQAGQPAVVPDVATYPDTAPFAQNFAEMDIRAFVAVPCLYEGQWVAVLAINSRTVQEWQPHQVTLLQNTVSRLWSIIEQTRATQALRESEERFRSALLNAPLPIMLHTEDGEVLQINQLWTKITGYRLKEIPTLAAWIQKAYGDRQDEVPAKIFNQYPLTERTAMGEYIITTATGAARIWDFYAAPLPALPDGRRLVITTAIDITERKQAEQEILNLNQELQRQLAESQTLLEVIPIGVGIAEDPQCEKIRINSAFAQMLAIAPTANASLSAPESDRPTNFQVYQNHRLLAPEELPLQRAAAYGIQIRDFEVDVVWDDGTTLTLLEYAAPLFDEQGKTRGSIGAFLDITERKQADIALQRSLKDLADFKFALDSSSIVAITDTQGTITYVNDKFCELSQYSKEELIGQNHRIINSGYHPKEFFQHLWSTISKGQVWQGEIKNRAKDGTFYWVATTIVPFLNAHGKPYQYIAVRSDITNRKQAEAELLELNSTLEQRVEERTAQLQEANKDLEAFAYSVAHDLRAPLRGIQGFAEVLVEDYGEQLDETAHEYIHYITQGTERMNQLISDLLAYSRLSREQIRLKPIELNKVVAEAQAQLEADLRACQAQITVAPNLPSVLGHRSVLIQIVANLLSNAIKFVAPGIQPQIRVWAQTQDDWVRLWVEDNGIGIEPAHQQQIFGVFERLHGIEAYPGTGIGLAIVRKGAERLGGKAGVESTPNQGSRFWIELQQVK